MSYIPTDPVESSNIEAVGYDSKTKTLRVVFHGGRAYDYPMVPKREFEEMMAADSKGQFFNARIRSMYGFRNVRPAELQPPPGEEPPSDEEEESNGSGDQDHSSTDDFRVGAPGQ